jgi:DNA-binding winged helix-turn-helix (wHTH) protein
VDVYINYLRRKVDDGFSPTLIHTVRGVGYQMSPHAVNATGVNHNGANDNGVRDNGVRDNGSSM